MRAGPLSNPKIISLLNRYFVPIYASNEDYKVGGGAPPDEKAEYERIYQQSLRKGLSTGTVHVYLLSPAGEPIDSLHVVEASKMDRLVHSLQSAVERLKTADGPPVAQPAPQSAPPAAAPDSLILHLTARGFNIIASWREFPSEDWIVLGREEWTKLLNP